MKLVRFCRKNRYAIYLLTLFLTGAGLVSMYRLPSNIYPELNFPRIMILAHSGDLAPDAMLLTVTRPIEESVSTVLGVRRVRSKTIRGAAEISVLFNPDMEMQYALQLVEGGINEVRSGLPPDTQLQVVRVTPTVFPVYILILNGNVPGQDLRDWAFYDLRPQLSRIPGVGGIEIQASDTREVSVIVDPQKMLAHHVSLVDISDRLRGTNQLQSVGRLQKDYRQYLLLSNSQFTNLDQVRNTVVAVESQVPVRLGDIADVRDGVEDRTMLITGNGQPAALINISRQIGGNILELVDQIRNLTSNLGTSIPSTLHLSVVYDLAQFVRESMNNVRDAILIGAILAILILFVFLREGRVTLIAATSLPLSVIGTFFLLHLFGGTLNLMSLGGLAIAIGLIIDDAVVIIENIYRHLGKGETAEVAAEKGTGELIGAVVSSTATTLVVFLPLGLLTGVVGEFFRALCLTLGASILLSLLFAITLIPLLSEVFLTRESYRPAATNFIEPVNRAYEKTVRWALRHRAVVAGFTLTIVAAGVFLYTRVQTGFLPEIDEGGFVVDYITPPGTSLDETDKILRKIERLVAALPETAAYSRRTGAEMGLFATGQNSGDILVLMKPRAERERRTTDVIEDLREQIQENILGVEVEFVQLLQDMIGDLEGAPEPIEVKLFGPNMDVLEKAADEVGKKLQNIPGIVDYLGIQKGNPGISFQVDPLLAGRLGMTVEQVSGQIRAGLLGLTETSLRQADRTIDIRVRFPDTFRFDYNRIRQFPILTPEKQIVPLSSLGKVEQVQGANQVSRENQRLMVALTARLEGRDLGSAVRDIESVMQAAALPTGMSYEIGGQYESQQSAFRELLFVLGLALAAVFAVLVIQFRAFLPALIIISAAPLSLVGVFAMLEIAKVPLNVSSFMGIILMIGLVVKNGIILFEYVHKLWEDQGMPLSEALVQAGRTRVRPILMTTLATLFGLLPLALGIGSGAEIQKPLALAVIGGLLLSTFITLFVMPLMYSLLEHEKSGDL
jgi:CzcA family heavy metal efflux pump